jgi:hypothetical protein
LDERDFVEVEALPRQDLPNLLARILIKTPSLVNHSVECTPWGGQVEDLRIG